MITKLPIKKPALAGETGFSLLARNTAVNGSATTAEFCASTGLSKAAICAGKPSELARLAALTGSSPEGLLRNSPEVLDRKFVTCGSNKFLGRSIRKVGQMICPWCWLEDLDSSCTNIYIRSAWLPKVFHSCASHASALIGLPAKDYTSCYDHMIRSRLEPKWLQRLEDRITPLKPSAFEVAAHRSLASQSVMYPWIGTQQIDVLEQWALGIGFLIKQGAGLPTRLPKRDQLEFVGIGHHIMLQGQDKLYEELDTAVTRHRTRLTRTWLHQWAMQSTSPPERQKFRTLITQINDHQGRRHILNGTRKHANEVCIRSEIEALATELDRSKHWIRRTLQREKLLPDAALDDVQLRAQMARCRTHIRAVAQSLTTAESAQKLNLGIKSFEKLVHAGMINAVKSRTHKKPRFKPDHLNKLLRLIDSKVTPVESASPTDHCSIVDACFQYRLDTAVITQLLISSQLTNTVRINGSHGYGGIYVNRSDILTAMKAINAKPIAPFQLRKQLGLSFADLKTLDQLGLLPAYSGSGARSPHASKRVSQTTLDRFLDQFQTVSSAAQTLGIDMSLVYDKIRIQQIECAPEAKGLPIFYRDDLLN